MPPRRNSASIGSRAHPKGRRDPPESLCDRVLAEVADFAADMPQYDDQTLLLVRRVRERRPVKG